MSKGRSSTGRPSDPRRSRFRLGMGILLAVLFLLLPLAQIDRAFETGRPYFPRPEIPCCILGLEVVALPAAPPETASVHPADPAGGESPPCCPEGCRRCPRSCCGGILAPPGATAGWRIPSGPAARARTAFGDAPSASREDVFHPPRG